ncbi:DNA-binding response regulator, LytR/AlgR family [Catalinimonas alkaloidigena]|uniref:DNA-binding response regulator, LytR/AlgR family n=1 Tax=Catalinimonas alkaloidigena TaxID=1075417 RepID=A0A1G9HGL7_9BACT|nr:response regulator transcription factor [Catalinimonas alkaloidigena]SDL12130.1 DNA-binding response regulator, LytR/AlgR family [Catalinimonas alkaloidigena]
MNIRCLAVDDEPLALKQMAHYIERVPFLTLVGTARNATEALQRLSEHPIDLIFLDIQMPDLNGIQLMKSLQNGPKVIFTTAYEKYALEGFRLDALQYLLKPFSFEEFLKAATKAHEYFEMREKAKGTTTLAPDALFVKADYKLVRIPFQDIICIEGLKDYVKIHTPEPRPILSLLSLRSLEEKLPDDRFMRVHRSFIVALDRIETINKNQIAIGKLSIPIGDLYKENLFAYIDRRLP